MNLSPREHEILTLLAFGYTDKEVAQKLKRSIKTVQSHITKILLKMNARNRVNAVAIYVLVEPKWQVEKLPYEKNYYSLECR